jgi:hypothetical protein
VSDGWRIAWFSIAMEQSLLTPVICFGSLAGDLRFFAVACLLCGSQFDPSLWCLPVSQMVGRWTQSMGPVLKLNDSEVNGCVSGCCALSFQVPVCVFSYPECCSQTLSFFSLVKSPPLTLVIRFGSLAGDLRFFGCLPAQWFSFRSAMSFRFSGRAFNGSSPQIECGGGVRFRTLCVVALQPIQSSCTIILLCAFSCPDGCSEFPFCLSLVKDPLSLANLCSELRRGLAGDVRLEVFFGLLVCSMVLGSICSALPFLWSVVIGRRALSMGPALKLNVVKLNVDNRCTSGYRASLSSPFPVCTFSRPSGCNEILPRLSSNFL